MSITAINTIPLPGCAPVPLAHYLKALGILRLVAEDKEHGDPQAKGFWKNDCFSLSIKMNEQGLTSFFLNQYQPTPIIVPWSGNDFFAVDWKSETGNLQSTFEKRPTSSEIIEAFLVSKSPRLARYRNTLRLVPKAFEASKVYVKKDIEGASKSENKARLLQVLRNLLPDDSVAWLDCTTAIEADQLAFNTILGSGGGSDGNSHFSDNFMQALWMVLPEFEEQQRKSTKAASGESFASQAALQESIFGSNKQSVNISKFSPVLFDSSRVGGINSISGFNADSASNPWDFALMMEGAFLFAGAVSKKLRSFQPGVARFPFLLEATPVGLASVGNRDEGREIWLPLWDKPSTYAELAQVFAEARIEKFGRTAATGFDAFLALASYGVDRGIKSFQRVGLVRGRVGGDNYFTSIDQGRFRVRDDKAIDLLQPLDRWHSELLRFAGDEKKCPQSIFRSLRQYEASVAALSQRSSRDAVTKVIIALGQIEMALAKSLRKTKESGISPAPLLSPDWLEATNTDNAEFRLARSLASTWGKYGDKELFLRQHLEPVVKSYKGINWDDHSGNDVVWHEGDFVDVLNAIFGRRVMKAIQTGSEGFPDSSPHPARLDDLAAFIDGHTDNRLLADLVWGLSLIDWPHPKERPSDETPLRDRAAPSSLYALLRLCFRPKHGEEKFVPAVAAIHRHAAQGNGTRASVLAAHRLFASGYEPAVDKVPDADHRVVRRTAASLLFPIAPTLFLPTDPKHYTYLQESVLRRYKEKNQP